MLPLMVVSCSETNEETDELADWQNRNETYFKSLYETAKSNPSRYKIIRNYSLEEPVAQNAEDNIIVEVLNEGTGTSSPLYTDSVRVHYRGSYIPTASWPAGYVFDQSWTGDYNLETMCPATFAVSSVIDGFTTALLNMKPGDRWRVTILTTWPTASLTIAREVATPFPVTPPLLLISPWWPTTGRGPLRRRYRPNPTGAGWANRYFDVCQESVQIGKFERFFYGKFVIKAVPLHQKEIHRYS